AHVVEVVAFVDRQGDGLIPRRARHGARHRVRLDGAGGRRWCHGVRPDLLGGPVWEKPTPQAAAMCLARGWLWNTFVMVAKASALVSAADVLLPGLHRRLTAATPFL